MRWVIRTIRAGDIWRVRLTDAEGHEQQGTRPVIVLAVHNQANQVMVTSCTGRLRAQRFPFTHRIGISSKNDLTQDSIALVYQTRTLTVQRFLSKLGEIDDDDFEVIKILLKTYLCI